MNPPSRSVSDGNLQRRVLSKDDIMIEIEKVDIRSIPKVISLLHCPNKRLHHNIDRSPELNYLDYLIMDASHDLKADSWPRFC